MRLRHKVLSAVLTTVLVAVLLFALLPGGMSVTSEGWISISNYAYAAPATVTYYYTSHASLVGYNDWTNPANMVDGNLETFASETSDGDIEALNFNSCPGTDLGTITKVELRVYGYGDGNDRIDLTPFKGFLFETPQNVGNEHQNTMPSSAGWSGYSDITSDPNRPSPWTWDDVVALDCLVEKDNVAAGGTMYCAKTEIRITYTTPDVPGPPLNPVLTYVNDYKVDVSWTKGDGAENTMVRAKYGSAPEDRMDGYQVYYGTGTSVSDTEVNLDDPPEEHVSNDADDLDVYYRMWSQNAGGTWENTGVSDSIGGHGMITIGIVILALGLTTLAFVVRSGMLYAACMPVWLIFTFYMFNQTWPGENTYLPTAIAIFGIIMIIIMVSVTAMHYVGNKSSEPTYDEEKATNLRKIYNLTHRKQPWE